MSERTNCFTSGANSESLAGAAYNHLRWYWWATMLLLWLQSNWKKAHVLEIYPSRRKIPTYQRRAEEEWDGASIGELIFLNMYYMLFILIISFSSPNLCFINEKDKAQKASVLQSCISQSSRLTSKSVFFHHSKK